MGVCIEGLTWSIHRPSTKENKKIKRELLKGYTEVGSDTEEGMHKYMGTNALID
jgi:hypothetical protein